MPLEVGSREVTIRLDDPDATSPAVERRLVQIEIEVGEPEEGEDHEAPS